MGTMAATISPSSPATKSGPASPIAPRKEENNKNRITDRFRRSKQKIRQMFKDSPKTEDIYYSKAVTTFNEVAVFHKKLSTDVLRLTSRLRQFHTTLCDVSEGFEHHKAQGAVTSVDSVKALSSHVDATSNTRLPMLEAAWLADIQEPLDAFGARMDTLRIVIKHRRNAILDYDASKHKVSQMRGKLAPEDEKLLRAEEKLEKRRELFERLNSEVITTVPKLNSDRPFLWNSVLGAVATELSEYMQAEAEGLRVVKLTLGSNSSFGIGGTRGLVSQEDHESTSMYPPFSAVHLNARATPAAATAVQQKQQPVSSEPSPIVSASASSGNPGSGSVWTDEATGREAAFKAQSGRGKAARVPIPSTAAFSDNLKPVSTEAARAATAAYAAHVGEESRRRREQAIADKEAEATQGEVEVEASGDGRIPPPYTSNTAEGVESPEPESAENSGTEGDGEHNHDTEWSSSTEGGDYISVMDVRSAFESCLASFSGVAVLEKAGRGEVSQAEANESVWAMSEAEYHQYRQLFWSLRPSGDPLPAVDARLLFVTSGIPGDVLASVWILSDLDGDGQLAEDEFALSVHYLSGIRHNITLPGF